MNRPLLLASALALAALAAVPLSADAQRRVQYRSQYPSQASQSFDGFCYVRENSVRAETETDYWGTRRGYGRCYRGEYYVFAGRYATPPRPPEGYVARYFTRRPDQAFYDRIYNALTLTENFEPPARDDARDYGDRDRRTYDDRRYENRGRDDSRYDEYPADETYPAPPRAPIYNTTRQDAEDYGDDQTTVGRYEKSAPSDDYARDSRRPDADGYIAPYDARPSQTQGWQDDQGAWHVGRPRAIGWQDEYGQWHVGEVQTYGWRDRDGQWHETPEDGQ